MANPEHLSILQRGLRFWDEWRHEIRNSYPIITPDLSNADLQYIVCEQANFRRTDLSGANLNNATVAGADFTAANLSGANLSEAALNQANFSRANLDKANLSKTVLHGTIFNKTKLSGANFTKAEIGEATFANIDFSETKGLGKVIFFRPSMIDMNTLFFSKGNVPEDFLRGCGLSDLQVELAKFSNPNLSPKQTTDLAYKVINLHSGSAIQHYSCFISYSSRDNDFAIRLHDDLQKSGVRCWFAPIDMRIGDKIRPTIDKYISLHEKLLVILSKNSIESHWVESEVEKALEVERSQEKVFLFPIRLDNAVFDTNEAWAADIRRTRNIGDFSKWRDNNEYRKNFEKLFDDLKVSQEAG